MTDFDELVEDYTLAECLIIDKEYKREGRNLEKEGISHNELKARVRARMLTEHPELANQIETEF